MQCCVNAKYGDAFFTVTVSYQAGGCGTEQVAIAIAVDVMRCCDSTKQYHPESPFCRCLQGGLGSSCVAATYILSIRLVYIYRHSRRSTSVSIYAVITPAVGTEAKVKVPVAFKYVAPPSHTIWAGKLEKEAKVQRERERVSASPLIKSTGCPYSVATSIIRARWVARSSR